MARSVGRWILIVWFLTLGPLQEPAVGQVTDSPVTFYTDEATWAAAVNPALVTSFDTSAANIALADEVQSAPSSNEQLGPFLTFDQSNTGLCGSFTLMPEQTLSLIHI